LSELRRDALQGPRRDRDLPNLGDSGCDRGFESRPVPFFLPTDRRPKMNETPPEQEAKQEAERIEAVWKAEDEARQKMAADVALANKVRPDKIRRYLKKGLIGTIKMIRLDSGCSLKVAKLRAEHVRDKDAQDVEDATKAIEATHPHLANAIIDKVPEKKEAHTTTEEAVYNAFLDLDNIIGKYLAERGWTYRCDYPDSYWRWEKEIVDCDRNVTMALSSAEAAYALESDYLDV